MSENSTPHNDVSFDPAPVDFRRLGYRLIESMIDTLDAERSDPVPRHASESEIRALLDEALPHTGTSPDDIMTQWSDAVSRYCRRNWHPRFSGYICTSADPLDMLADAMASAVNQPVTAWRSAPSAAEVRQLVVRWLDVSRRTFTSSSEYTTVTQTDPGERYAFFDYGLEMFRRFRGLKVWTILKARGVRRIAEVIRRTWTSWWTRCCGLEPTWSSALHGPLGVAP